MTYSSNNKYRGGFTLIELSIALVIIGLVIGGILVGQNLILAAQVRQQVKQLEEYSLAYNAFKIKYNCIPGDCRNATAFFSGTTNGNGNGILESSYVLPDGSLDNSADAGVFDFEFATFFTQLSLANFIDDAQIKTLGYPAPKFPHQEGQGFTANSSYNPYAPFYAPFFTNQSDDYLGLGKWKIALYFDIGDPSQPWGYKNDSHGLLTPLATYQMDMKIDDGKPQTGKFKGGTVEWTNTNGYTDGYCLTPTPTSLPVAPGLGTEYNVTNTKTPCIFGWKLE